MHPTLPHDRTPRAGWRRLALASGLLAAALAGGALVALPLPRVQAQQAAPFAAQPSLADLVDRVKGAVVSIQVTTQDAKIARNIPRGPETPRDPDGRGAERDRQSPPRGEPPRGQAPRTPPFQDDNPLNEFFKKFPEIPRPPQAQGSGFLISADGYVVTNNHVIADAGKVQVIFDQDNRYEADVVGTDDRTDLALLKIKASGKTFPFVTFATTVPRVGDWVVAVGNPFGLGGTVTAGIVSAHGRDIGPGPYDFMQIDAAVNKGNSGGPSFNLAGEVVGVNTAIYSPSGFSVGIAFAIPARTANDVITQLKTSGTVKRGWLGVKIQNLSEDIAASLGLRDAKGALVAEVQAPSPAAEAGIRVGDTILTVNGNRIADSKDLARQIAAIAPGTKVDVKVLRAQKEQAVEQTVAVKLGLLPSSQELSRQSPPGRQEQPTELGQLGLTVAPNRDGVVVTDVDRNSDAAQKVRVGDVILEINGNPVTSSQDLVNAVREANRLQRSAVLMRVRSGNETRFVGVRLRGN